MTPEEKASELINTFWPYADSEIDTADSATECAIICVKEIVSIWANSDGPAGSSYSNPGKFYWKQVLKHLESR